MYTAQQRHAEDQRQLMEEICHTAGEIRQTSERLCEMAATTQQMSRVAVQVSQVARQKRQETLNEERKTPKNLPILYHNVNNYNGLYDKKPTKTLASQLMFWLVVSIL
jgi:hypothetical protein